MLDLPETFWSRAALAHLSKASEDERRRMHFFASSHPAPVAACDARLRAILHGDRRKVLKSPPLEHACRRCHDAWRAGWGQGE